MNGLKSILLLSTGLLLFLRPMGAANLAFGQVEQGTIAAAASSNSYTFSGSAGDVVDFTMVTTSGTLIPKITLYSPTGSTVAYNYAGSPYGCGGSVVELNTVVLTVAGTYTVIVSDCANTNTGNYNLYAQSTKNPSSPVTLPFGGTEAGNIGSASQNNTYTFSASAGGVADFTMTATSGSLIPRIRIYTPSGTLLSSNYAGSPYGCGGTAVEINTLAIPTTGTYTVLLSDCGDTNTGNYEIYAQLTDSPPNLLPLTFGQTQGGTISAAAQNNAYTFSANANDVVDFTLAVSSGALVPRIRLYGPTGALVNSNYAGSPYGCGGATVEMNTTTLQAAGTYTVLVGDCSDANIGSYYIYSQRTNNPGTPINLPFGQAQTGLIGLAAQSNTYSFSANAGDIADFTMTVTNGALVPKIRVYGPTGAPVGSTYGGSPYGCGGSTLELNSLALATTGTYTVLVGDCSDENIGNYTLYAQRTNNPSGASPIQFGATQGGVIGSAAQSATYAFSASANAVVEFTVTTTSGVLIPKIRLYGPTGALVASNYSGSPYGCGGSSVAINPVNLASTGTYTVLVGDCGDTNKGNFNLSSQCIVGTCTPPPPSSISITASSASLVAGSTEAFSAVATYGDGSTANITAQVTWNSSNPSVATISASGLAVAISPGSTNITASLNGVTSTMFALSVTPPTVASATFLGRDSLTQGTWTSLYGGDGYLIANGSSVPPSYASVNIIGDSTYTWASPTTDQRALQTSGGASSRIASTYYSFGTFSINVNLSDGNAHRVALYLLDWDSLVRSETISILNAATSAVLSTQSFSNFHNGLWVCWNITGDVIIQVTDTAGANAVVSGVFFDVTPSSMAKYVGLDTTTEGTWTGVHGADGNIIAAEIAAPPSYATVSVTNAAQYTWAASPSDQRAVQISSGSSSRIASTYYAFGTFTANVNMTDGNTHRVGLYLLDWDSNARSETITVADATTHLILDTETYSNFNGGAYAIWDIKGSVVITVTETGGANAVVSGLFFDPTPSATATASYVGTDTSTQGAWTGKYGSNGQLIANDVNNSPSFATVNLAGDSLYTWNGATTDPRALQVSGGATSRIASTYYSAGSFSINVNLTDGGTHKVSLYLLDWDSTARAETITIVDAISHATLDSQSYSSFHGGEWAVWNVTGNVIIQVTDTSGANAVVSGVFFD